MTTQPAWTPEGTFPERLALIRNRHRWNMKEAALACGVSPATWRTWEFGASPHNYVDVCHQIAERSDTDFMWLLSGSDSRQAIDGYVGHLLQDRPLALAA